MNVKQGNVEDGMLLFELWSYLLLGLLYKLTATCVNDLRL